MLIKSSVAISNELKKDLNTVSLWEWYWYNRLKVNSDTNNTDNKYIFIRDRDRMVVGFTTTCVISAYHHKIVSSNPVHCEMYSIQHYVTNLSLYYD
jgi:hypothetical protein